MDFIKTIMGDIEPPGMYLKNQSIAKGESKYPIG